MKKLLFIILGSLTVATFGDTVARPDVPNVANDFWNTSVRSAAPVQVCVSTSNAATGLDARRPYTRAVSNGTDIKPREKMIVILR